MKGAVREPKGLPPAEPRVQLLSEEPLKRPGARTATLAALAVAVAGALLVSQLLGTREQPPLSPSAVAAAGMASTAVATYLSGTSDDRNAYFGSPGTSEAAFYVAGADTVLLAEQDGAWRATVAVHLLSRVESGYRPEGLHYYHVGLTPTANGWRVSGPPALVAPPVATPVKIDWDETLDETIAEVAGSRLSVLADDLTVVRTSRQADRTLVEVVATVGGHAQTLVYELTASDGRYVITGVG